MNSLSPKKQEIRDRERRILQLARQQLMSSGYSGLALEAIATELDVSRGTIYNHFASREEIVAALLLETSERRLEWFQRAAAYRGTPRARITAVTVAAELFARLVPEHGQLELTVRSESIWSQTSYERQSAVSACRIQTAATAAGIVRDAVAQCCLTLPDSLTAEDLVFALSSVQDGAYSMLTDNDPPIAGGLKSGYAGVRLIIDQFLDGLGWTPLSTALDFGLDRKQILTDLFATEFRQLKKVW